MKKAPHADAQLRQRLATLNSLVHSSLNQPIKPKKAEVLSLVKKIQSLARGQHEMDRHCALLAEEAPHFCEEQVRARIRMLNAIQAMLWQLDAQDRGLNGARP